MKPLPPNTAQQPLIDHQESQQYLTFTLANELYAMNIVSVKEIIEYSTLTRVPMVPPYIRGILNLRGNVLSIIDLAIRFGWEASPITKLTCIIIAQIKNGEDSVDMGIVVDAVNDVIELSSQDIEPAPAFGNRIRNDFIRQIGKCNNRFIILLDIDHVLSMEELSTFEQIVT